MTDPKSDCQQYRPSPRQGYCAQTLEDVRYHGNDGATRCDDCKLYVQDPQKVKCSD